MTVAATVGASSWVSGRIVRIIMINRGLASGGRDSVGSCTGRWLVILTCSRPMGSVGLDGGRLRSTLS